ncbi:MAG TPA: glycosyl hydrolase-related protein [Bryobacteraceae bacterium]|nr:glycosyl hydrolase-related protein [Bryobacteraceae bacterium]
MKHSSTRRHFCALLGALPLAARADGPDYGTIRKQLTGRELDLLPFSHVDWAWVNSRAWMVRRHAEVLAEALDLLRENPDFRFYIENWNEQVEPFLARRPERVPELSWAISQGKFEACGGVCDQHPGWMESESLIRDMVMGRRLFERFAPGLNLDVLVHNDVTPGSAQMPQIVRKAGYRYYRINRPHEALTAEGVPLDFRWKGLDGTELITSRGSTCGFLAADTLPDDFANQWQRTVEKLYQREILPQLAPMAQGPAWMAVGCDDALPLRFWQPAKPGSANPERLLPVAQLIQRWNQGETSHMRFATPLDFFHELEKHGPLPVHNGILDPTMWTYWYGLNGNQGLRLWRARTDQALVTAEAFWNCAAASGDRYPEADFARLWSELLRVYSHAQMWLFAQDYAVQFDRLKSVHLAAAELKKQAMLAITRRVRADGRRSVVLLFNDLPWERTEVVEVWAELQDKGATNLAVSDSRGSRLEHQVVDVNWYELPRSAKTIREAILLVKARVPAMGYTAVYIDPAPGTLEIPERKSGATSLETSAAHITFSGHGIESVRDPATGASYTGLGNVLYNRIRDTGPYHYGPIEETMSWSDGAVEEVVSGPLRSSFTISGKIGPHFARLTGHVVPQSGRISFRAVIDSAGGSGHFVTSVGLPDSGQLSVDTHFAVEDRDVRKIRYGTAERKRENVFYGAHWTDYSGPRGGLTLIGTTGEKGYQYTPSKQTLAHFLLMTLPHVGAKTPPGADAWERFVTPAREGTGRHEFDYQFLLHAGDSKEDIVRHALQARFPITVMQLEEQRMPAERNLPEEKSFVSLSGAGVQLSAFYREGGAVIARLYESAGARAEASLEVPAALTAAKEIDFNGRTLTRDLRVSANTVRLTLTPWEIVTLSLQLSDSAHAPQR